MIRKFIYYIPVLVGILAFLFSVCIPASEMQLWCVRIWSALLIGFSFILQASMCFWFLLSRRWKYLLLSSCFSMMLLLGFILTSLSCGPNIDMIQEKVSKIISVPQECMQCLGGSNRREPIIIFELPIKSEVNLNSAKKVDNIELKKYIQRIVRNYGVSLDKKFIAWKINLECDTVIIIKENLRWLIIFNGLVIL